MSRMLVVFEDSRWQNLRPLTDLVPVPALTFGASNLAMRWVKATGLELLAVPCRSPLERSFALALSEMRPAHDDTILVANAAVQPGAWLEGLREGAVPVLARCGPRIAAARVPFATLAPGLSRGATFEAFIEGLGLPEFQAEEARALEYPWHLIESNGAALRADLAGEGVIRGEVHPRAALLAPESITIEPGARIDPLAVLDAREGPVRIGRDALVLSHTVVTGPCAIGERSQLLGGFIGHSTIGPQCRIAGEVEDCIWQGYGNKRHHGFVGHSVIGEWVNLGALTTTSDLKNNYGRVRVWIGGREIDSGSTKIGSIIGAHVKTGIGTLLPTGCVIGTGSNLFAGGRFAPKSLPAFSWWDGERLQDHRLDPFLATARIAMSRRDQALDADQEAVLRALFESSARERAKPHVSV